MATRLTKLELDEISLVDKGMNPKTKVVLAKRAEKKGLTMKLSEQIAKIFKGEKFEEVKKELPDPSAQLAEFIKTLPEKDQPLLLALISAVVAGGGKAPAAPAPEAPKPEEKKSEEPKGAEPMKPDEVAKALKEAPVLAEIIKGLSAEITGLTEKVKTLAESSAAEVAKSNKAKATEIAKGLKHIPGVDTNKLAELITKSKDGDATATDGLVEILSKANTALSKRLPMQGAGNSGAQGDATGSAKAEFEELVSKRLSEVRKSADGKGQGYTYQMAYADVMKDASNDLLQRIKEEAQA